MAEIPGATITWTDYDGSGNPRLVNMPDSSRRTVQDIVDTLAAQQAELDNLVYDAIYSAAGKEELSATEQVGITLTLQNARIKFPDPMTPTLTGIDGGNLVAVDGNGDNDPDTVDYTSNILVNTAKSTSAALLNAESGVAAAVWSEALASYSGGDTAGFAMRLVRQMTAGNVRLTGVTESGGTITVYATDNSTVLATFDVTNDQKTQTRTS